MSVIDYRFRLRRGLAADWTSKNPVLLGSEIGHEKDTGKIKIGDGTTAWNGLPYYGGVTDSGWQNASLLNGWTNFGGAYSTCAYRKIGNQVSLRGMVTGGTSTDGTPVFTLPAGFRPPGYERFRPSASVAASERVVVRSDTGQVEVFGLASGSNLGFSGINFFVD